MPIYEFACPQCRVIFSFLSKRTNPGRSPVCPRCGNSEMTKQLSQFAAPRRSGEGVEETEGGPEPDFDDPKVMRAMAELERDMGQLDENNPRQMAEVMRKLKSAMPPGTVPKEIEVAIKRLEAGEDPEKIEADMGDVFASLSGESGKVGGRGSSGGDYSRDPTLHDY